ncbi:MAG: ATP-binding protein [Bacteroidota bacterium]|nr:ATP-binding protein [Bacteroidota bacterium]
MQGKSIRMQGFMNKKSECTRIIVGIDWDHHPLGKPETWPPSLVTTLSILLNSKFPMFLFWGKEHYCFYNDAYKPSLGNAGKHPDAIGKKAKEVWPEIWDIIYPQIKQVMEGGEATWHEDMLLPIFRNNKIEDVYWTYSYSPVFEEKGNVTGVFVTCTETTAKVHSEKELIKLAKALRAKALKLQESENKYKMLFQNSPLPKFMYDLETLHILDVNDAALEKYGYSKTEFLSLDMIALRPATEVAYFMSMVKKLRAGKPISSYGPILHKKKNGNVFTVEVNLHKNIYNGKEAVIKVITDITEKQVYENKLKQLNESLIKSNRELQQFASITAHDLQEPLRMISNFTGLLEKKYSEKLDEKALQYIYFAKDGATRMQHLIADILEYARLDGHAAVFELVNIDEIINQVLEDLKHRIKKTKAVINYPGVNVNLMGNTNLLYRLFLNLISNALKFVSNDTNPVVSISLKDKDKFWQFAITDNGIGIAAEDQPKLFIAFNRLHSRESFEGSGLGLATCKKIVEQHHGKIWVESEEGKGTTFYINFQKISA